MRSRWTFPRSDRPRRAGRSTLVALLAVVVAAGVFAAACSQSTGRRRVARTAFSGVEVVVAPAPQPREHPRRLRAEDLRTALRASGYLIDSDIRSLVDPMVAAFGRLGPSEDLMIVKSNAHFQVFAEGRAIVLVRFVDGAEEHRMIHPLSPDEATPTQVTVPTRAKDQAGATPNTGEPPRIWTFAVGVSKYAEASLALRYAHKDASAVDRFFASKAGGATPKTRRVLLTNKKATRSAVLSALARHSRRVGPRDILVVYLAMHALPDDGGDLYFLAHDTRPSQLVGTGLPQRDVEYALANSQAERIVLLLDTCHAGSAGFSGFKGKRGLVVAQTHRLLARLADTRPGVAVLSASSAAEASNEGKRWGGGHGVFTHFMLAGLAGRADLDNDSLVSIRELYDFVYGQVSAATDGRQHPELKGSFDNAMPLSSPGR